MPFPLVLMVIGLELLFVFFWFGQELNSYLINLKNLVYISEWYRYPRHSPFTAMRSNNDDAST